MNSENEKRPVENKIGQDFDLWGLIKFTTPSILMQICSQLFQTLDDGLFVSRYVGEHALAAINLLSPVNFVRMGVTQLLSMGASTIAAEKMGEGKQEEAKQVFTKIVIATSVVGLVFGLLVNIFAYPICDFLGADETTLANAVRYIRIVYGCTPVHLLAIVLTSFYSTCGKPQMGLFTSILNGSLNIILDVIFIPMLEMGVTGSSLSTVIGDAAVMITGFIFYSMKKQEIHFVKPVGEFRHTILQSCSYASSQFVNSMSLSVFNLITNRVILSIAGPDGIAANAITGDLRRILNSAISGYAACVAPVIAFNCGSRNYRRLKRVFNYNLTYWFFMSMIVTTAGLLLRKPLIGIFFKEDYSATVYDLTLEGLTIEFSGIALTTGCIILNRMFVAMNEVKVAAFTSFMRNIVFRVICTLTLPFFFGMTGVWFSFTASEIFSFSLAVFFFIRCLPRFNLSAKDLHFALHEE